MIIGIVPALVFADAGAGADADGATTLAKYEPAPSSALRWTKVRRVMSLDMGDLSVFELTSLVGWV
jgi:hypothetical protein